MFRLCDKLSKPDQAAAAFAAFVEQNDKPAVENKSELSQAYKYLANYHVKNNKLDIGYDFARKCLN